VCLSAHVVGDDGADRDRLILDINRTLHERFGFGHSTLQVEGASQAAEFRSQRLAQAACEPCGTDVETGQTAQGTAAPRGRAERERRG
jgi:hypothetical protein